jgi:iron complex outermembrane receptor protein
MNDGTRNTWGAEYRGRFEYPHFMNGLEIITGNFYYTYTEPRTNRRYNHEISEWESQNASVGDIAPHKINASVYLPINNKMGINIKGNYSSPTELYSRNPLSKQGIKLGSRVIFDLAINYTSLDYSINLQVKNLFDHQNMLPGIKAADSGNNFTQRSLGFSNSLIPQASRSLWLTLDYYL